MQALSAKIAPGALMPRVGHVTASRKAVVMRAKEMREFREDTGEVTVAGEENKDKALYADQVQKMVSDTLVLQGEWARRRPPAAVAADCAPGRWREPAALSSPRSAAPVWCARGHSPPTADGHAAPTPAPQANKQDNMSKEMKARLRKEYIGFGGAENQVRAGRHHTPPGGPTARPWQQRPASAHSSECSSAGAHYSVRPALAPAACR
jgi:hypothetical protein